MSSRSNDAATLAQLARQLQCIAGTNVQLVNLIEEINTSLGALTSRVNDLEEANDDLERRLLKAEQPPMYVIEAGNLPLTVPNNGHVEVLRG